MRIDNPAPLYIHPKRVRCIQTYTRPLSLVFLLSWTDVFSPSPENKTPPVFLSVSVSVENKPKSSQKDQPNGGVTSRPFCRGIERAARNVNPRHEDVQHLHTPNFLSLSLPPRLRESCLLLLLLSAAPSPEVYIRKKRE